MEPVAAAKSVWEIVNSVLKIFGKKIVDIDKYKDQTYPVKMDYHNQSLECLAEKERGAEFVWSEYEAVGYERYYELHGDIRKYFWNDSKQYLLIKRKHK